MIVINLKEKMMLTEIIHIFFFSFWYDRKVTSVTFKKHFPHIQYKDKVSHQSCLFISPHWWVWLWTCNLWTLFQLLTQNHRFIHLFIHTWIFKAKSDNYNHLVWSLTLHRTQGPSFHFLYPYFFHKCFHVILLRLLAKLILMIKHCSVLPLPPLLLV